MEKIAKVANEMKKTNLTVGTDINSKNNLRKRRNLQQTNERPLTFMIWYMDFNKTMAGVKLLLWAQTFTLSDILFMYVNSLLMSVARTV